MMQSLSMRGDLTGGMIRLAIFILAAVQLAAGDSRPPGPPIYKYSSELDRALPQLPSGFVRTLSFSFSPDEQWFCHRQCNNGSSAVLMHRHFGM
jgi:hypothetical protein